MRKVEPLKKKGREKYAYLLFFLLTKKSLKKKDTETSWSIIWYDPKMILMPSKKILYNTAYVPNSNMATSASVSVYCTFLHLPFINISPSLHFQMTPSDIHVHVSWWIFQNWLKNYCPDYFPLCTQIGNIWCLSSVGPFPFAFSKQVAFWVLQLLLLSLLNAPKILRLFSI